LGVRRGRQGQNDHREIFEHGVVGANDVIP
jgi:hypothetical protein